MKLPSEFPFWLVHCWCIKTQLSSVYRFCTLTTLQLCQIYVLVLVCLFLSFIRFLLYFLRTTLLGKVGLVDFFFLYCVIVVLVTFIWIREDVLYIRSCHLVMEIILPFLVQVGRLFSLSFES